MTSMKMIAAVCLLPLCLAVDYQDWKENKQTKMVTTRERKIYEGVSSSLDACLSEADKIAATSKKAMVQFQNKVKVCTVFETEVKNNLTESVDFELYTKSPEKGLSDDGITTGGLIATIILAILFSVCLLFLALNCKEEKHSIAEQIENLEKREMELEEAVSEEWEKRSEAEEREVEMQAKEADQKAQ